MPISKNEAIEEGKKDIDALVAACVVDIDAQLKKGYFQKDTIIIPVGYLLDDKNVWLKDAVMVELISLYTKEGWNVELSFSSTTTLKFS